MHNHINVKESGKHVCPVESGKGSVMVNHHVKCVLRMGMYAITPKMMGC